jgi:hypothetical protein
MSSPPSQPRQATQRDLLYFCTPRLWPIWPVLPVIRQHPDGRVDLGVLFDFVGTGGPCGYSATVFLTSLLCLPESLYEFLALPKETFDTPEEMAAAGWRVD